MIHRRIFFLFVLAAVLLVPFAAMTSCSEPLPPDYGLDGPRLLAVRSSPPDLVPGGSVELDALVFVPTPTDDVTYEWSWCASVDANLSCAQSASSLVQQLDPDGGLGVKIDYALGTAPSARLEYPVDSTILQALCSTGTTADAGASDAGDAGDDADAGDAGTELRCNGSSVSLTVLVKVTVNGKEMRAAKSVTVYATQPAFTNSNPTIASLEVFENAATLPPDGGDRSDEGIADAAGSGVDASAEVRALDDGGVQLLMRVPTTATDTFSQGGLRTGGGGGDGGANPSSTSMATPDASSDAPDPASPNGGGANDAGGNDAGGGANDAGGGNNGDAGGNGGGGANDAGGNDAGGGANDAGGGNSGGASGDGGGGGPDNGGASGDPGSASTGGPDGGAGGTSNTPQTTEMLTATWYVQAGLLDSPTTTLGGGGGGNGNTSRDYTALELNRWVPPGPGLYTIVVVLRDNRNGVGWSSRQVRIR